MKETPRARQAWADYLAMGPGRSLEKLAQEYRTRTEAAPTRQLTTLKIWSQHLGWQARLSAIADREAREAEEREAAYRREIMEEGYGLAHERVRALKALAGTLYGELQESSRRWLPDVKQVAGIAVDIERFNAAEIEQLRGLLDDIAKEKGDRKVEQKHSGELIVRQYVGIDPSAV